MSVWCEIRVWVGSWCCDGSRNVDVVFLVLAASTVSRVNVCRKDRVMFVTTVFLCVFCIVCGWVQSSPTGGRPKNGSVAADGGVG